MLAEIYIHKFKREIHKEFQLIIRFIVQYKLSTKQFFLVIFRFFMSAEDKNVRVLNQTLKVH